MGLLASLKSLYGGDNAVPLAKQALENAKTHLEYEKAALLLDFLEGRNAWKAEPLSPDYDSALISARYNQLRSARLAEDFDKVLFLLRTTLSRNLGDMGNAKLYSYTHIGTKHRIEEYIAEVGKCFQFILKGTQRMNHDEVQDVLNTLLKTRQSFGRTALLFSGGGTLGMMHIGVVKTLFEAKLLPRVISGSSAGAIVAAIVCTQTDEELPGLVDRFPYGNLQVFQKDSAPETIWARLGRFLKHGVFMDITYLHEVMSEWMGDMTFAEAFNKTRRVLNITVSSTSIYEMPRLLNYITSPNVIIWSAIAASCSIPLVFAGSPLLAKDPKTGEPVIWDASGDVCIDGSIEGDLPATRISELFNINHFIVSQVNPHVTPFLPTASYELENTSGLLPVIVLNEVLHFFEVLVALGIAPVFAHKYAGILKQRYTGNITILPYTPLATGLLNVLTNPTPEFMLAASFKGEKATWPRMSLIRNHLEIETNLDTTLYEVRLALIQQNRPTRWLKTSQSQSNLDLPSRHHHRHRSNSIISNASVEIEPFDLAPIRNPRLKSGPPTPRFEVSPFNWDNASSTFHTPLAKHHRRRASEDSSPIYVSIHNDVAATTSSPETEAFARAIDQKLSNYGYSPHSSRAQSPTRTGTRSPQLSRYEDISRKVSFDGLTITPNKNHIS